MDELSKSSIQGDLVDMQHVRYETIALITPLETTWLRPLPLEKNAYPHPFFIIIHQLPRISPYSG